LPENMLPQMTSIHPRCVLMRDIRTGCYPDVSQGVRRKA
jgi:hypothetical protein